jgi:hypothetical protein
MTASRCRRLPHIFVRNPSKGNNSQCVQRRNRRATPNDGAQNKPPPAAMQALSIIVNKVWEKRDEIKRCACEVNIGLRALISGNDLRGVHDDPGHCVSAFRPGDHISNAEGPGGACPIPERARSNRIIRTIT